MKLSHVSLVFVAACGGSSPSSPSSPKAPDDPAHSEGRAERIQIGSLEAYALRDGHFEAPNDGKLLGMGRSPAEIGDSLAAAGLARETFAVDLQYLLVSAGDRVLLFDTGIGGELQASLALSGIAPSAVTDIFISHAHTDHVGGLLAADGALAFPAATIHISAPEWKSFQREAETDADAKRFVTGMTPKVDAFEPGAQLLPMVKAVATPGHTPGHSSYEIRDGGGDDAATLFFLGDVAHHSVISVQHPTWSVAVDADHDAANLMRQTTLAMLAGNHTRVFAPHFPFPGVGHVAAQGDSFVWQPDTR
jgi:glyoxylase-like metal-dependent hydrolase (beta-lactamase superfamily II)